MATSVAGASAAAIPLDVIFSDITSEHKKWRLFHMNLYLSFAEKTYEYRFSNRDYDDKDAWDLYWKGNRA